MGKHNQDVQVQLNVKMKRLESEREKMPAEKKRPEQELQEKTEESMLVRNGQSLTIAGRNWRRKKNRHQEQCECQ